MPRKILKRFMPDHKKIREHPQLQKFGQRLTEPKLWHLNRRSVSLSLALGLFISFMPILGQMFVAAVLAMIIRINLPITIMAVWVSNPLTIAPLYFFAYKVGSWILKLPVEHHTFTLSMQWFTHEFLLIWQPFLLGCIVCGLISALIGILSVRLLWRLIVIRNWLKRKRQKRNDKH